MTSSESVHDGYTISRRPFKQESVKDLVTTNDKLKNWPVVYILSSPKEVYVGETLDYDKRMRQHLDNDQKQNLELTHVILQAFIPPGQPWHNGFVESVHNRMRDELLEDNMFSGLDHARTLIAGWSRRYDEEHPTVRWAGSHPTSTRANGHNTTNNNQQPSKHPVHKTRPGPTIAPDNVQDVTALKRQGEANGR